MHLAVCPFLTPAPEMLKGSVPWVNNIILIRNDKTVQLARTNISTRRELVVSASTPLSIHPINHPSSGCFIPEWFFFVPFSFFPLTPNSFERGTSPSFSRQLLQRKIANISGTSLVKRCHSPSTVSKLGSVSAPSGRHRHRPGPISRPYHDIPYPWTERSSTTRTRPKLDAPF